MNELTASATAAQHSLEDGAFGRWLSSLDRGRGTIATYCRSIAQFRDYLLGNGIASPDRQTALEFKQSLDSKGLKATTINGYLSAMRRFFAWTAENGIYPNIAKDLEDMKVEKDYRRDYLVEDQCIDFLDTFDLNTLQGKRDNAMALLMMNCGLRTKEVAGLDVEDFQEVCFVPGVFVVRKGHHDKSFVDMDGDTAAAIEDWLKARGASDGMEYLGKDANGKAPMFVSVSNHGAGERIATGSVSRMAKQHLRFAGMDDRRHTAHSLRHTCASIAFDDGASLHEVQTMLGHEDPKTTERYIHMKAARKYRTASRVSSRISKRRKEREAMTA